MNFRKLGLVAIAAAAMSLPTTKAQAACGEVTITEMNWASAQIVTAVAKFLMEQGYGCKVTKVPSASNPALTSVAETGKPDILTEIWTNGAPAYPKLVKSGKIKPLTEVLSDGGIEGWWVPNYLLEKHPVLATLKGIKANPQLVGGRFHNCPDGWTCKYINSHMAKAADLSGSGIEDFVHGSGETLAASIASAFADKRPWFGYYWAPTAILGKYPMTMVDIGPHDAEAHKCNSKKTTCDTPKVGAYPKSIVTTVVTDTFASKDPEVTELMRKLKFSNKQMADVLAWKEDSKASGDEAAVHFLTKYKSVWGSWLNDAAKKKLAALLK